MKQRSKVTLSSLYIAGLLWNGIYQSMTFMEDGQKVTKGMEMVLQERGISTHGKNKEWMHLLSEHSDFKHEKSMIETLLVQRGHTPLFLPKFHPVKKMFTSGRKRENL